MSDVHNVHVSVVTTFSLLHGIPLYEYTTVFLPILLLMYIINCFQFGTIVNKGAMNILNLVFWRISPISIGYIPRSGLLDHSIGIYFILIGAVLWRKCEGFPSPRKAGGEQSS